MHIPSPKQFTYPASRLDFPIYGQLHGAQNRSATPQEENSALKKRIHKYIYKSLKSQTKLTSFVSTVLLHHLHLQNSGRRTMKLATHTDRMNLKWSTNPTWCNLLITFLERDTATVLVSTPLTISSASLRISFGFVEEKKGNKIRSTQTHTRQILPISWAKDVQIKNIAHWRCPFYSFDLMTECWSKWYWPGSCAGNCP